MNFLSQIAFSNWRRTNILLPFQKNLCSHCSFAHLAPGSSCCIWYETKTSPTSCSRWWWNEIFFELPHITLLVHQDFHFPFLIMFFKDFWQYFFNDIVDSLVAQQVIHLLITRIIIQTRELGHLLKLVSIAELVL